MYPYHTSRVIVTAGFVVGNQLQGLVRTKPGRNEVPEVGGCVLYVSRRILSGQYNGNGPSFHPRKGDQTLHKNIPGYVLRTEALCMAFAARYSAVGAAFASASNQYTASSLPEAVSGSWLLQTRSKLKMRCTICCGRADDGVGNDNALEAAVLRCILLRPSWRSMTTN